MSKRAIVSYEGNVNEIVEAGDEFEIYEGPDAQMIWMDVPDDIDLERFEEPRCINGEFVETCVRGSKQYLATERINAYLSWGEQLDMQYRDKINGTTEWEDHITAVKAANAKPSTGKDEFDLPGPREKPQWEKI